MWGLRRVAVSLRSVPPRLHRINPAVRLSPALRPVITAAPQTVSMQHRLWRQCRWLATDSKSQPPAEAPAAAAAATAGDAPAATNIAAATAAASTESSSKPADASSSASASGSASASPSEAAIDAAAAAGASSNAGPTGSPGETTDRTPVTRKRLWNLGIPNLLREWKSALSAKTAVKDFIAGVTVPMISIPVALGSAVVSGVPPHLALAAAVIGGTGAALFGGTRIAVTGPATGMAFALSPIIQSQGLDALILASIGAGALQIGSGIIGFGSFMKSVIPLPVLWAFPTGVGAALFISQLSRAVELPPLTELVSRVMSLLDTHTLTAALSVVTEEFNPTAGAMALCSFLLCVIIPRTYPKFPVPICTVAALTLTTYALSLPVTTLHIPDTFFDFSISIPTINWARDLPLLISNSALVFTLSSMQSVLTSRALEKIVQTRYDANQELIGQGISNICCGLFGALPVTSLIVQSTMNYMTGAQTRLSSVFAASTIALSALVIYPFIAYIPIPALIGSLLSVAWRMMSGGLVEMRKLRGMCTPSFGVYSLSGSAVMSVGVTQGVIAGLSTSVLTEIIRNAAANRFVFRYRLTPFVPPPPPPKPAAVQLSMPQQLGTKSEAAATPSPPAPEAAAAVDLTPYEEFVCRPHHQIVLSGALTFLSTTKITHLFEQLTDTAFIATAARHAEQLSLIPPAPFGTAPQIAAAAIPIAISGTGLVRIDLTGAQQLMELVYELINIKESKKSDAEKAAERIAGRWVVVLKKPVYTIRLIDFSAEVLAAMSHFDTHKILPSLLLSSAAVPPSDTAAVPAASAPAAAQPPN